MNPKSKIRSDYHAYYGDSGAATHAERSHRWLKSLLILSIGFVLGLFYHKSFETTACNTLALSEVNKPSGDTDSAHQGGENAPTSSKA